MYLECTSGSEDVFLIVFDDELWQTTSHVLRLRTLKILQLGLKSPPSKKFGELQCFSHVVSIEVHISWICRQIRPVPLSHQLQSCYNSPKNSKTKEQHKQSQEKPRTFFHLFPIAQTRRLVPQGTCSHPDATAAHSQASSQTTTIEDATRTDLRAFCGRKTPGGLAANVRCLVKLQKRPRGL